MSAVGLPTLPLNRKGIAVLNVVKGLRGIIGIGICKREGDNMAQLTLPQEKSVINKDFSYQKFGIIGISGIGKSSFFAQDPKAFFIETEPGLNFIETYKLSARSWEDIRNIYRALSDAPTPFPYNIIVIDTIDKLVDYAEEEVVNNAKKFYTKIASEINTIGEIPQGGGWSRTRQLVNAFMDKLNAFPCALAYIGHCIDKRVERGVKKYDRSTISIWKGMGADLLAWPDHLMQVDAELVGDQLVRTVYTKPTQSRECKSRGAIIPDGWRWDVSDKVNYDKFRGLFK